MENACPLYYNDFNNRSKIRLRFEFNLNLFSKKYVISAQVSACHYVTYPFHGG